MKTNESIFLKIVNHLKKHNVNRVSLFGSYLHEGNTDKSDIDLIVSFKEKKSLFELSRIERELTEAIGIKIDLLTEKSISKYLIDKIKSEERILYAE